MFWTFKLSFDVLYIFGIFLARQLVKLFFSVQKLGVFSNNVVTLLLNTFLFVMQTSSSLTLL
jgi:hypothetical protein